MFENILGQNASIAGSCLDKSKPDVFSWLQPAPDLFQPSKNASSDHRYGITSEAVVSEVATIGEVENRISGFYFASPKYHGFAPHSNFLETAHDAAQYFAPRSVRTSAFTQTSLIAPVGSTIL